MYVIYKTCHYYNSVKYIVEYIIVSYLRLLYYIYVPILYIYILSYWKLKYNGHLLSNLVDRGLLTPLEVLNWVFILVMAPVVIRPLVDPNCVMRSVKKPRRVIEMNAI